MSSPITIVNHNHKKKCRYNHKMNSRKFGSRNKNSSSRKRHNNNPMYPHPGNDSHMLLNMQWDLYNRPMNNYNDNGMDGQAIRPRRNFGRDYAHPLNTPNPFNNCQLPYQSAVPYAFKQNLAAQEGFMHGGGPGMPPMYCNPNQPTIAQPMNGNSNGNSNVFPPASMFYMQQPPPLRQVQGPNMPPNAAMPMPMPMMSQNPFNNMEKRKSMRLKQKVAVSNTPSIDYQSQNCAMNDSSDFSDSIDSGNGTTSPNNHNNSSQAKERKQKMMKNRENNVVTTNLTSTPSKTSRFGLRRRTRNRNSQSHSFSNNYDLIQNEENILGQGAYATVRLAIRKRDNKRFAVKIIDKHNKSNTREKCMNELRQLQRCKGAKNILNMHEFYDTADRYYIVTEYMAGGNLHDRLKEGEPVTEYEAACITRDLARALTFLHQNRISHRDIKPQNILCKSTTSLSPVVLSDFDLSSAEDCGMNMSNLNSSCDNDYGHGHNSSGSSNSFDSASDSASASHGRENSENPNFYIHRFPMEMDSPVGSPEYMSPEIANRFLIDDDLNFDKYTEATDIWSLGVLLFKALSGDVPFKALGCEDRNCQWEEGQACQDCQTSLWEEIVQADLKFKSKMWAKISTQARHLVTRCLVLKADERITAAEILQHPFIKALGSICEGDFEKDIGSFSQLSMNEMNSVPENEQENSNERENFMHPLQNQTMNQQTMIQQPIPNQSSPGIMISNNHHHMNTLHYATNVGLTNGRVQVQANVNAVMPMPNVAQQCRNMQLQQPSDSYKLKQLNLQAGNNSQQKILARKIAQKQGLQGLQGEMKIAMFNNFENKNDNNTTKITDDHDLALDHAATDSTILLFKEFTKVLQEYPEFQLNADQLEMLDAIEKNSQDTSNDANTKLAELLIDQDSGHGVQ